MRDGSRGRVVRDRRRAGKAAARRLSLPICSCFVLYHGVARKGELSSAGVDRGWPHQVALPADACTGAQFHVHARFCAEKQLSLCPRGHAVVFEDRWYTVFCFAEKDHAAQFMAAFGGEPFDPDERGRGRHWAQWRKGTRR
jgi:hypothetical protein